MNPAERRIRSADGTTIAVHDYGGSGPSLILAHATGFHGRVWDPMVEALDDSFNCVSFDFRGHGGSPLSDGADLDWNRFVDDLLAVIDEVAPEGGAFVVGHSLGGGCAALAEDRRPGAISRAWAFEPILLPSDLDVGDPPIAQAAAARRPVFPSRDAAYDNYASKPPLNALDPRALLAYVRYGFVDQPDGSVRLACEPEHEAGIFRAAASGSAEAIRRIAIPYAVVAGNDGGRPAVRAREEARRCEHVTLFEVEINHFGPLIAPGAMAAMITDWFG